MTFPPIDSVREKRKLESDIEKGITAVVEDFVKTIIARRKKESSEQFDDYLSAGAAKT